METLEQVLRSRGLGRGEAARPRLVTTPLLDALRAAGTRHVYGDTADVERLRALIETDEDAILGAVDGNTANQPLVRNIVERELDGADPKAWARELCARQPGLTRDELMPLLYAIVCARVGNAMTRAFAAGRGWEASLQLHMHLGADRRRAVVVGRLLRSMAPSALVKVPFTPDAPHALLVARDLERAGVPVNLTSTFSARQAVVGALLADVTRTNIFMGRLDQGLDAQRLGAHVDLCAQRALLRLRQQDGVRTQLIIASMRSWRSFVDVAGCDVFTAPCDVLQEFLEQEEVGAHEVVSRLETSYEGELGVSPAIMKALGRARIARLYDVEPELLGFLRELRARMDEIPDGDALFARFDDAGFGDMFHVPTPLEREELARGKLPELDGELIASAPLDTHYSLLANADFSRHQAEIDEIIGQRLDD